MANTLTSPTRHIDRLIRYVLTEKKDQAKGERWVAASAGNGFVVDANASVKIATDVMRRHRKLVGFVQGYHVIDSYAVDELDPSDPEDFERAQKAGRRRARRLAKGRPYLVVTQVDGKGSQEHPGGKLHNHIVILSTHPVTGRAFDSSWVTHKTLAAEHDEVLAEVGITQTLPPALAHRANVLSKAEYELPGRIQMWESKRDMALEAGEAFTEPMPVVWIADLKVGVAGVMAHTGYLSRDEAIEVARAEFGLDLRLRGREDDLPGISWSVLDEQGNTTKMTRRSSTLGTDFGCAALDAAIERNIALQREQQAAQPALSAVQQEWLERVSQSYGSAFDARMAMTGARVDVADQNAVMEAWEQAKTADSGVAVADQTEHIETAENSGSEAPIDADGAVEEAHDPEVGREWVENGSVVGAADSGENGEALENEDSGSGPDGAGMATPRGAHLEPTSGSRMGVELRPVGSVSDAEDPEAETSAALERLDRRYRTITEGASWSDDEYDQVLARIDALKARLGLADAPPPSRETVLAEYEERVLGLTRPIQHEGAEPSSPPGSSGPSPAPPGLVDAGAPSAPASVKPTAPYRSEVWELAEQADDPKAKAAFAAIARFDEESSEVLMAGGRIPNSDVVKVSKGTGDKWQRAQVKLGPIVRHEMLLRADRMAERRKAFEAGKALKARLEHFGEPGCTLDEYRDTESRLAESNAQVRLLEARMNVGIYEQDSKWRPGQPIPDRAQSWSMRARLRELAEQALDEETAVEDPQPGS